MSSVAEEIAARREAFGEELRKTQKEFTRGRWITDNNAMQNPEVRRQEVQRRKAPKRLAHMKLMKIEEGDGYLETEDREVTDRVKQADIVDAVDMQTQQKKFDLVLDKLGPYTIDYTQNGSHLAMVGLRGHLASFNWKTFGLEGEVQLKDRCTDVKFLVDSSMMAVAQKRYVYMYSKEGTEMHVLPSLANCDRLAFLPKHLLLVGASSTFSMLSYMDASTGQTVATKTPADVKDPITCMKPNPTNGVVAACDLRGIVKFWSPNVQDPLAQLKAHKGAIQDVAFHSNGRFFVTLGGDHKLKVWDCRTMRALEDYGVSYCFDTIDISYTGLVAMGGGTNVQVWKNMFSASKPSGPYMKHGLGYGNIATTVRFCPFEDVLGIGHSKGFSSIIIPGSGEANPDFFYANPHETERHRKDRVVSTLLDKLPADTITMDLQLSGVNEKRLEIYNTNLAAARKTRNIREKKQRRADLSKQGKGPTGVAPSAAEGSADKDYDELDEELGYAEKPAVSIMLSKQELLKQRKMNRWDKKDTSDKIRSKQKMRQSKIVVQKRKKIARVAKNDAKAAKSGTASTSATPVAAAEPHTKKARIEQLPSAGSAAAATVHGESDSSTPNAAFHRFSRGKKASD